MIDKLTPKFLATSRDERLSEPGSMIDAQNVTISQEGDGSLLIVKNAKGTIAASASTGSGFEDGETFRVIGSVSNDQVNELYFFVCCATNADLHGIYRYKTATNTYSKVIQTSWLNFDKNSFVKGNVVNRNFQQDNKLQTVLYFTDNVNPPRKINISRANDYSFQIDNSYDHAIGAIKAPLIQPPTFSFYSDESIKVNNFVTSMWQFATQLIYKDGEESALSPYSEIAASSTIGLQGLDDDLDLSGKDYLTDNVLSITIPYSSEENTLHQYRPEVISMRLLGRDQNNGAWLIIDEFDPNEDLVRRVYNSNKTVYDSTTKVYTFYNEGIYSAISDADASKTYDNVPLKAEGQAFVGNRIMYSNYVEGFPNYPKPSDSNPHKLDVKHKDENEGAVLISNDDVANVIVGLEDGTGNIDIRPLSADAGDDYSSLSSSVSGGAVVQVEMTIRPHDFSIGGTVGDGQYFWGAAGHDSQAVNNAINNAKFGITLETETETINFVSENDAEYVINEAFVMPANSDVEDVLDEIVSRVDEVGSLTETYLAKNTGAAAGQLEAKLVFLNNIDQVTLGYGEDQTFDLRNNRFAVVWKWSADKVGNEVVIKPYPSEIKWINSSGSQDSNISDLITVFDNPNSAATTFVSDWEADQSIEISDNVPYSGSSQSDWDSYAVDDDAANYLRDEYFQIESKGIIPTFKSGASHKFGIVYYDKYGRHGFVNDLGETYVESFQERAGIDGYGASEVQVVWNYDMPDWADRWSIVYGGNTSFDNAIQYTVGSAFTAVDPDHSNKPDYTNKRLYVSLATLDKFKDKKSPTFDYSFTKGDKLRIVSHKDSQNANMVYPTPDGVSTGSGGRPIEFNVVDVVTLGASDNPLTNTATAEAQFQGTFLVLDAPDVNAGAVDQNSNKVKFNGYDWFTVSKARFSGETIYYPGEDASDGAVVGNNKWHQNTLVEIISPKTTDTGVFYEIGVTGRKQAPRGNFSYNHGPNVTINGAEYWMRTRSCATKDYDSGWGTAQENLEKDMIFRNRLVETKDASDFFASASWSKGKPHVKFERAAEVRRYNGVTYSDAYEEDVANLSLSSFNASLANFFSFDSKYGAARYIENYNEDLLCLQENKLSLSPISKDTLRTASDLSLVSLSTNVIGASRYYSGDYGVEKHPESVLINDGDVFFADLSRRKVLKFNPQSGGIVPISDTGVASLFEDEFAALTDTTGASKIVSGYDPKTDVYYITMYALDDIGNYAGKTIGYDSSVRKWISTYTFVPEMYAKQNRLMYSCRYSSDNRNLFYRHEDNGAVTNRNQFYGDSTAASIVEVVSNANPSVVKQYNSVSIEGNRAWDTQFVSESGQDTGIMISSDFVEKEDAFYYGLHRDTSSNSTSQYIGVGTVSSVDGEKITMSNSLRGISIPLGSKVSRIPSGSSTFTDLTQTVSATNHGDKTITISAPGHNIAVGDRIFLNLAQAVNGDHIRGHYSKVKLSRIDNAAVELYAINAQYVNSRLNHG